jgi:hypothetical protein
MADETKEQRRRLSFEFKIPQAWASATGTIIAIAKDNTAVRTDIGNTIALAVRLLDTRSRMRLAAWKKPVTTMNRSTVFARKPIPNKSI